MSSAVHIAEFCLLSLNCVIILLILRSFIQLQLLMIMIAESSNVNSELGSIATL